MKRDYFLGNFTLEGCSALPDFYPDPATGELRVERRSVRGRAFRADYRHLRRWFVIVVVVLVTALCLARWAHERAMAEKDAEIERLQPSALPAPTVERPCLQYAEIPAADTTVTESCNWTVTWL